MHNAQKEIVEKIIEKEVIKEVRVGISEVSRLIGAGSIGRLPCVATDRVTHRTDI